MGVFVGRKKRRKEEKRKKKRGKRRGIIDSRQSSVSRRCSRRVPAVAACTVDVAVLPPVQSLRRAAIRFPGLGKQVDTTFWFPIPNILIAVVHFGDGIALSRALPIVSDR